MIRKYYWCILVLSIPFLYQCAPKATKTTTSGEYYEDLSLSREPIDLSVKEDEMEAFERGVYVAPTNHQNNEMEAVIDTLTELNLKKPMTYYSIQVYVGNNRDEANAVREKVYRLLPEAKPRLAYQSINYRVKVGWYVNRIDANEDFQKLRGAFPGALLVTEKVYPKKQN